MFGVLLNEDDLVFADLGDAERETNQPPTEGEDDKGGDEGEYGDDDSHGYSFPFDVSVLWKYPQYGLSGALRRSSSVSMRAICSWYVSG